MEPKAQKFRLRLNLFDAMVLILALLVGAFLLWHFLKPAEVSKGEALTDRTIRYTILFTRWDEGDHDLIHQGDRLQDTVKNLDMGTVVSAEAVPCQTLSLNHETRRYELATLAGKEDVKVTVEATCSADDQAIVLASGYDIHVGLLTYLRGAGYMASGPVIAIEREGLK